MEWAGDALGWVGRERWEGMGEMGRNGSEEMERDEETASITEEAAGDHCENKNKKDKGNDTDENRCVARVTVAETKGPGTNRREAPMNETRRMRRSEGGRNCQETNG